MVSRAFGGLAASRSSRNRIDDADRGATTVDVSCRGGPSRRTRVWGSPLSYGPGCSPHSSWKRPRSPRDFHAGHPGWEADLPAARDEVSRQDRGLRRRRTRPSNALIVVNPRALDEARGTVTPVVSRPPGEVGALHCVPGGAEGQLRTPPNLSDDRWRGHAGWVGPGSTDAFRRAATARCRCGHPGEGQSDGARAGGGTTISSLVWSDEEPVTI